LSGKIPTVRDILKGVTIVLHPSKAETSAGNTDDFYVGHVKSGICVLDVTAFSGFTSVHVIIQNKDPESGKYDDVLTFSNVTGTKTEWKYSPDAGKDFANWIRCVWKVAGTGSITFSVCGMFKHS